MVQVLERGEREPSFGEKFGNAISGLIRGGSQMYQQHQQKQAIEKLMGPEVANMPPELQQLAMSQYFKNQFAPEKVLTPLQESQKALADERLNALKSRQELFNKLSGDQKSQQMPQDPQAQQMPQGGENVISQLPESNLSQLAAFAGQPGEEGIIGNMAKAEIDRRKETEKAKIKSFESERDYHTGYSKELEKNVNQLRETLPRKEMALNFARDAIETGNASYFSPDKLADATGIDLFRTSKGAQLVTAGKENLLSNMSRVGAKAQNIWFEQRLNSMFPKIGQSQEANLTVQEMLEGEAALDKAYIDEFDRLSEEDEKNFGYIRKDISKRVHQAIKPLENHIMARSSYRMKEIEEQEKGLSGLKKDVGKNVPKGTPLTMAMAKLYKDKFGENALNVAEKNGYRIPTVEEWTSYQERPQEFREGL